MTSRSTQPGPTDGSWSTSPTSTSRPLRGMARNKCTASWMSIMLVSSTISTSVSSGLRALWRKVPIPGSKASSRWMVLASRPDSSAMRFAARPVGAHSISRSFFAASTFTSERTSVVLPTPGPPVITSTLWRNAPKKACFWPSASSMPSCFCTHSAAAGRSIFGHGCGPLPISARRAATSRSAKSSTARYTHGSLSSPAPTVSVPFSISIRSASSIVPSGIPSISADLASRSARG